MKLKSGKNEQGYALISALFLIVILVVIGTLVMRNVTNSQGMVNVSSDLMAAQADAETKLLVKLAEVRGAVMTLKEEEKITLKMVGNKVQEAASPYLDERTINLDEEKLKYSAVITMEGRSGKITQTASKKIEITLSYVPKDPPTGGGNGGYAVVSQGAVMLNGGIIEGNVYVAGGFHNNNSTIKGQVLTSTSSVQGITLPERVEVTSLIAKVDQEASKIKGSLPAQPSEPDNEVKQSLNYSTSKSLKSFKLMQKTSITVDGDLLITGELTMESGSTITATGNIIIEGNLLVNGGEVHLNAGSGKFIRVKGTTNFNSDPKVIISGTLYTNHINLHGTLLAGNVYVGGSTTGTLSGYNQFALYDAGALVMGGKNKAELTGLLYSNGSITLNGNSDLTIHGGGSSSTPEPSEPQEIYFDEKNMVIE
ncbi:hypothetical protein [Paenibacillus vini]|uniref:Type 4 fimbrial biogenesis protein PilX N-terminal domain-containing protein n=1 Tax=Paenibacillus vini TaxID=1476024 RepID=A0ABQ4M9U5_9BACL|nr:hypothetical protein [Paenibacillus vini]GIP52773.1 hypothetical protein J42TS3_18080 [Paenibacillus vini]